MIKFLILLNDKLDSSQEVKSIMLTSVNGDIKILPNHAHSFFNLQEPSDLKIEKMDGVISSYKVENGVVEFFNNECRLITNGIKLS